jgi:hypothetical protein
VVGRQRFVLLTPLRPVAGTIALIATPVFPDYYYLHAHFAATSKSDHARTSEKIEASNKANTH